MNIINALSWGVRRGLIAFYRLLANPTPALKLFADEQLRWQATAHYERGLRTIAVEQIVGAVDRNRSRELDTNFQYRALDGEYPVRLRRILDALQEGAILPPIDVAQIKDEYFVIDGHHRVAAAKILGQIDIDATIYEYLPDPANPDNALFYQRRHWTNETGLRDIRLTGAANYSSLLSWIHDYRQKTAHAQPNLRDIAQEWYSNEYLPVVDAILAERIPERFPGKTVGDIFAFMLDRHRSEIQRFGYDPGIQYTLQDFIATNGYRSPLERMSNLMLRIRKTIETYRQKIAPARNLRLHSGGQTTCYIGAKAVACYKSPCGSCCCIK